MVPIKYQRLTRTRANSLFAIVTVSRNSLWLGADHLLVVKTSGYIEHYKRFRFEDIQSVIVQKTVEGTLVNLVLTVLIVLTAAPAMATSNSAFKIFMFILAGLFALFLLFNLLQGSTCRCYLRTAVQVKELSPLSRVPRARKIMARLRPLIAAAQGGALSAAAIAELMREPEPAPPSGPPPGPGPADDPSAPPET